MTKRIALVTGGMGGIGTAICKALAHVGHTVVTTYSKQGKEAAWLADMRGQGFDVHAYHCDVTDTEQCAAMISHISAEIGTVSILVNNAGITADMLAMRLRDDEWDAVLETNLSSAFRIARACLRGMMKARRGRIVNVSSVVATTGNAGQSNYCAAKAGMEGMTRALAREMGSRGVTVNCVAPGFIDTDMTRSLPAAQSQALLAQIPLGRLGHADEVAAAVLFLASPAAAYVTGSVVHVNGGMAMT